ncbi:hypothetical protein D3C72_2107800 [compost metagenome]
MSISGGFKPSSGTVLIGKVLPRLKALEKRVEGLEVGADWLPRMPEGTVEQGESLPILWLCG